LSYVLHWGGPTTRRISGLKPLQVLTKGSHAEILTSGLDHQISPDYVDIFVYFSRFEGFFVVDQLLPSGVWVLKPCLVLHGCTGLKKICDGTSISMCFTSNYFDTWNAIYDFAVLFHVFETLHPPVFREFGTKSPHIGAQKTVKIQGSDFALPFFQSWCICKRKNS
jgi:hypothetical protein